MNAAHLIHQRFGSLTIDIAGPVKHLFHRDKETFEVTLIGQLMILFADRSRSRSQSFFGDLVEKDNDGLSKVE